MKLMNMKSTRAIGFVALAVTGCGFAYGQWTGTQVPRSTSTSQMIVVKQVDWASVVTSKPANDGHFKTGQRGWPGTVLFYLFGTGLGKPVLVLQLRGPHLRMWP